MSSAADIIAALGGNPTTGMCKCPAHDDDNPSLHVSDGHKGVVWRCHAGCSQEAVRDALRARGLLADPKRQGVRQRTRREAEANDEAEGTLETARRLWRAQALSKEKPTAYLRGRGIEIVPPAVTLLPPDKSGRLIGKRFPAMVVPITDGEHLIGAHVTWLTRDATAKLAVGDGNPRRMYGQAKGGYAQLSEMDPAGALVIGEGIESTLAAMQISGGLPGIAALSAGGLAALRPPAAAEYIIAADNDDAGRGAAAALAERLRYEGRRVRIALPAADGADWNDVLRGGGTEDDWQAALDADDGEASSGLISALEEINFMELAFPERTLFLEPWLPRPGLAMIYAPRGEGKTWLALSVGKAVAGGHELLGWRCPSYGRVLYCDGELPGRALQDRLNKFRRSPPGMFHVLCRDTFLLRRQLMPDLGDAEGRQELDRIIKLCRPDVIIIDSISTMVRTGVENEAESWAPIQDWLLKHRWQGRTVILVHHTGKSGQQRGTSKREDVMDTVVSLQKRHEDSDAEATVFELRYAKSRDFHGDDAEPLLVRFAIREELVTWSGEPMRDVRRDRVRQLIDAGMKNKEIAREIGVTPGRVSQIVKELKREGNVIKFPSTDQHDHDKRDET
jgi:putative DNA primase/helicase